MRLMVVLVSGFAALVFIAASGLMNFVFMTSLGKSGFEQHILGAVSITVSAFLALLPTLLLWAWRERRLVYIALGLPVFIAFGAFSLSSAIGFGAKNRGSISEDRFLAGKRRDSLQRDLGETREKLASLGAARPAAAIQEILRALEQDRRWHTSKSCQDATADASRSFCKGYFDLKAEAARAGRSAFLEARIEGLTRDIRELEERGAGREADNQAAVLGRLIGIEAIQVERGLTFFLAVLVEAGAALGIYFATGHMRFDLRRQRGSWNAKGIVIDGEILDEERGAKPRRLDVKRMGQSSMRRVKSLASK